MNEPTCGAWGAGLILLAIIGVAALAAIGVIADDIRKDGRQ